MPIKPSAMRSLGFVSADQIRPGRIKGEEAAKSAVALRKVRRWESLVVMRVVMLFFMVAGKEEAGILLRPGLALGRLGYFTMHLRSRLLLLLLGVGGILATIAVWLPNGHAPTTSAETAPVDATRAALNATSHCAYLPVRVVPAPPVKHVEWPRTEIDRFILAVWESNRIEPARDADPSTLCRRLYFDLTGLPPTPDELDAFVEAARRHPATAREQLVDRLLSSPRFGEHWARHWFDVVRFAESVTLRGFIFKEAWRYRDYLIDSFNGDRRFDQVIREHIAGDLLPHEDIEQRRRQLIATTFLSMGNW